MFRAIQAIGSIGIQVLNLNAGLFTARASSKSIHVRLSGRIGLTVVL